MRSFSQLAEKLEISQPALSKQIQALETELGVRLFDRNTTPIGITPAGESFLSHAKDLLYREHQLQRSMEQFRSGEAGQLTIGISPFRSLYLMPVLMKKTREKYPNIRIVLHEASSDELRKEASEGKYDLAVVNMPVDETVFDITPISQEELVLVVPDSYVDRIIWSSERSSELSLSDCSKLPFVVVGQSQEMRVLFDKLCAEAGIVPDVVSEVVGLNTARVMACAGIGATVLPMQFVKGQSMQENVTLFKIKDKYSIRQPVIITKRRQYLSEYAEYAIKLLSGK